MENEYLDNCNCEILSKAIEQNFSEFFLEMARLKGCAYGEGNDYNWVKSNGNYWPSGIFDLKLQGENKKSIVEDMVTKMKSGQLPATVMTGRSLKLQDYDAIFNRYGLSRKYEAAGMAIDLNKINEFENLMGLTISIAEDRETLLEWCKIVGSELFGGSEDYVMDFYSTVLKTLDKEKFKCFVGKYNEKVVATSFLYLNNGIAGIYFVANHREYRSRGIGRLITLAPLFYARERNYKIAILQASPLGEVIYKKIGFKEYSRLGRYRLD